MNDTEYEDLKPLIEKATGVDLDFYKPRQMIRRLEGYIGRVAHGSQREFCSLISDDADAGSRLKEFLTINVTEFFRDATAWSEMGRTILPALLEHSPRLNIWSAGCSYGAEPYTIAMLLESLTPGQPHRILATDLDGGMLKKASAGGPYTAADVKNVSRAHRLRWFQQRGDHFFVKSEIQKTITFRRHNLLRDAFGSRFDLIVCRNVVIYFSDEAKRTLNERFTSALKPGGFFFIGGTETLLDPGSIGLARRAISFYERLPDVEALEAA